MEIEKLREKFDELCVISFGNRINLVSRAATIGSGIAFLTGEPTELEWLAFRLSIVGTLISEVVTNFGRETLNSYRLTIEHIKEHGKLKDKFARSYLYGDSLFEYCPIQGVYLAAKKYDQLETFNKFYNHKSAINKV